MLRPSATYLTKSSDHRVDNPNPKFSSKLIDLGQDLLCILGSCDGRVVKAFDSKSNGVSPRRFESCSQRRGFEPWTPCVRCEKKKMKVSTLLRHREGIGKLSEAHTRLDVKHLS